MKRPVYCRLCERLVGIGNILLDCPFIRKHFLCSKTNVATKQWKNPNYGDLLLFLIPLIFLPDVDENNLLGSTQFSKNGKTAWFGNVFLQGKISLSGVIMPSGYLLLSNGSEDASVRLAKYGKKKENSGVTGPDQSAAIFSREWLKEGIRCVKNS